MGNLNCKSCNCAQFFEKKVELDLKSPMPLNLDSDKKKPQKKGSEKINYEILRPHVRKLEALWLGYTARKFVIHLRRQTKSNHEYFSRSEIHETLSKKIGMSEFRQKKKPFNYSSGAVYTGQWLGGFRDGFGTMEWPNGSKYQGNWSYSKPHGFGTFTHVDGDVYEGEWKICFVSPKDTFGTGSNLDRWKDMVSDGYLWLWIKQEIFKTEAPKKPQVFQNPSKSVSIEKKSVKLVQIDEEVQGGINTRMNVQHSVVIKSSEKKQRPANVAVVKNKTEEVRKMNEFAVETQHRAAELKKNNEVNEDKETDLKRINESSIEAKVTDGNMSHGVSKTQRRESESSKKSETSQSFKEEKKNTPDTSEPIMPEIKMNIDGNWKETPKASVRSSYKFSLSQKSIIITEDKPKKIESQDSLQIKRTGPPVIRFKKSPVKKTSKDSSFISEFDFEDSPSSNQQEFPPVIKRESMSSSISKQNILTPIIHEKDSESSSKSAPLNPISTIYSRITLSENSILEIKKAIADILTSKSEDSVRQFSQQKYKNGDFYIGELKGDLKNGRGKLIFTGGDMYEGEWKDDKQHGRGKMIWSNGAVYTGLFDNDEKSGIGEYVWADGACYLGEWRDNLFYGYGRYRWNDGRVYNGQWEAGVRQGFGVLVNKNGNKFEGEFQADKMHGNGVLTKNSGEIVKGVWVNGKLSSGNI